MLVSFAEEKTGECVVCCHRCGAFLMESASTTSYMVCPECSANLVVCVKKGKVSVFDDTRSEEELAKKRHARLTRYAAKINSSRRRACRPQRPAAPPGAHSSARSARGASFFRS